MNKQQSKEAILGKEGCRKEETPLTQFATFHPDMEMVEILLKGADINKSFNNQPLGWVYQFCEDNRDKMLELLFKYKYHALHFNNKREFKYLFRLLNKVSTETVMYVFKTMKKHNFQANLEQYYILRDINGPRVMRLYHKVFTDYLFHK